MTIQNRAPTASFTATPNPAPDRARRSPSTPPPPATPTAPSPNTSGTSTATAAMRPTPARRRRTSQTYATAGNRTIGLRVTDNSGATSDRRRVTVTIQNRAPDRVLHRHSQPGAQRHQHGPSTPPPRKTPTARSPNTSGTSTATAAMRSTADPRSSRPDPSPPPGERHGRPAGDRQQRRRTATTTRRRHGPEPRPDRFLHRHPELGSRPAPPSSSSARRPATRTARSPNTSGTSTATGATRPTPRDDPTTTTPYATAGDSTIGLRVTDNSGATATTTRTVTIQNRAPTATFTATPSPATAGATVTFNARRLQRPRRHDRQIRVGPRRQRQLRGQQRRHVDDDQIVHPGRRTRRSACG